MTAQTILPANTLSSGGYAVDNSVRLDGYASSTRMEATNSSAGSRQIFTFSTWLKRSALDSSTNFQVLYSAVNSGGNERIMFEEDKLTWDFDIAGVDYSVETSGRLYRDFSAWYHIVVTKDTTQSTEANRIKMYVNGVQQTLAEIQLGFPDQNANGSINMAIEHQLFAQADGEEFGGYACETVLIDGTAYAADSFGEFDSDSGIWVPIDVSGLTFGTNGFHMNYADSSALGNDVSGNNNDYTTANLAAVDQSTDTCTNNFATLNPLIFESSGITFAEGALKVTGGGSDSWTTHYGLSTIAVSTGKWFVESKVTTVQDAQAILGLISTSKTIGSSLKDNGVAAVEKSGRITGGGNNIQTSLTAFSNNDIAGLAFDATNGTAQFYRNGSAYGNAVSSIASDTYYFATTTYEAGGVVVFNFGSPPYTENGGNSDADGHGNFSMAVPSGYFALNTKNLAEYG